VQAESAGFESQVARLTQELDAARAQLVEAQLQKAATDEVLRAISQSTADVQPVFQAIVESAARLCDAQYCFLDRFDGKLLHFVAGYGLTPEALTAIDESFPMSPGPGSTAARAIAGRTVVQIPDLRHPTPGYTGGAIVDALQVQSAVAVPMLKDGNPVGVLTLDRTEAGYFPEHQVELLKTFADQAVIAFQNARLFEEVQARNRDVSEALEQQSATGAILRAIAASPTDIQPVLQVVVESATRFATPMTPWSISRRGTSSL
jgi:two-component system NtrC family sensor kinase